MTSKHRGQRAAFISVTTLFFAWGSITVTIDPLIASLKAIFSLSYAQAMLTQFAFFMAYGIVSLPAAQLVARIGYSRAIICALAIMFGGCLVIPVATHLDAFGLVLVALFIIASGITILQVAANPLAAALGTPEKSHFRLTLSQAFNSLGTTVAPWLASSVMLAGGIFAANSGARATAAQRSESFRNIDTAFLSIAGMIVLLAIFIWFFRRHLSSANPAVAAGGESSVLDALRSRWALLGAASIFLYVGAEVSIGSTITNFLHQPDMLGVPLEKAGKLVSLYWGGAMVGRFIGSALLTRVRGAVLLMIAAAVAALLCLTVSQATGTVAAGAALSIGLFNSIMFPIVFTVTLEHSSASAASTSGLLCMAIVGGAVLPWIVGRIADHAGLHLAYLVPMAAYVCISLFAASARNIRVAARGNAAGGLAH